MNLSAKIDVLLGVYNGASYIDSALESVRNQEFQDWCLWVRDDGSTDETPMILQRWQERLGDRMKIYPNPEKRNLGLFENYSCLLAACTAPYVAHIAHDDKYHANKLAVTLDAMEQNEAKVGKDRPICVYTDQTVIDGKSQLIAASHWKLMGWKPPTRHPLGRLLVHNGIFGATTLINRALIRLLGSPPRCEDTWFAWVGAAFGDLVPLPVQTVDFRRHGGNYSELISLASTLRRLASVPLRASSILHERLEDLRPKVELFLEQYKESLPPEHLATVEAFLHLPQMRFFERRSAILRYGLLYPNWLRAVGMMLFI